MLLTERELPKSLTKDEVIGLVKGEIRRLDLKVTDESLEKSWGGYFTFAETHADDFQKEYFEEKFAAYKDFPRTPKLLIVAPEQQLFFQVHSRRAETWRVVNGPVWVTTSLDDNMEPFRIEFPRGIIFIDANERHTFRGDPAFWGVIAKMWIHVDHQSRSNEDDTRKISDIYGRR